jgi:hypothetical protein
MTSQKISKISQDIVDCYVLKKQSIKEISDYFKINVKTIRRILCKNNVELRRGRKNLIGGVYGRLVPIKFLKLDNSQKCIWECKCECGNITEARSSDLISGKIKSCGCLRTETSTENIKISHILYPRSCGFCGIEDIPGGYFSRIRHGAFRRNLEYSVSKEYLWSLFLKQERRCALTGLDIYFNKHEITASLDRIDASEGYVEGNVWWLHKDINYLKSDFTLDELFKYCTLIVKRKYENAK